jgi:nicotinamide phosphoribosyltransferase
MKSTHAVIAGENVEIFKQPKTDSGKNSHKGLIKVVMEGGSYKPVFPVSRAEEESAGNELKTVYKDGNLIVDVTLAEIRARIDKAVSI